MLPAIAENVCGDCAEGLGRYATGLLYAKAKGRGLLQAAWLVTTKRLTTKQLSAD
jgi:hypothetical protein